MDETNSRANQRQDLLQLGTAIRRIRKEKGLTQEEIGARCFLHESYISLVERGRRNPTWGSLLRICRAMGIEMIELVRLVDQLERQ